MNFKPTQTKSIASAVVPLVVAMIAFKLKIYCTGCNDAELLVMQRTAAAIVLLGLCVVIYVVWSMMDKKEEIYHN